MTTNFLFGLLGFCLTIGILVTIHEWAHFYVARLFNVKILRFSIGFGKPLLSWRSKKDDTLYTLAPILLGGFVQMLGENREEEIAPEDAGRTFQGLPPGKRFLVAFAGPAINLIFAVIMFAGLYMVGVKGLRPEIAWVQANSIASFADFRPGDLIREIQGQRIRLTDEGHVALVGAPREKIHLTIDRDGQTLERILDLSGLKKGDELKMAQATGLYMVDEWLPAQVGEVMKDSPAAAAGLQAGDIVRQVDGRDVDLIHFNLGKKAGETVQLTVERAGAALQVGVTVGEHKGKPYLGLRWADVRPHIGKFETVERYPLGPALAHGTAKMLYYTETTYKTFLRLLRNQASLENMGGPLTIGDVAGRTLQMSWDIFLNFLGVVSLSLAAINLLPVPLLDGGHMLFCVLEMVRGKPLPDPAMKWLNYLGAGLIYALMLLVVGKDLWTYLW